VTKLALVLVALSAGVCGACSGDDEQPGASCRMPFTEYDVGPAFEGIDFETRTTTCHGRPNVTYIYGTCHATSDTGCSPPLEIQTWSACHRRPPRRPRPGDLEFRRGESTVVIFAHSRAMGRRAKEVVRRARRADPTLPATKKLRACGAR
jgi:hypothetical protein